MENIKIKPAAVGALTHEAATADSTQASVIEGAPPWLEGPLMRSRLSESNR